LRTFALLYVVLVAAGCGGASRDTGANTLTDEHRAALSDSVSRFAGDIVAAISAHDVDRFMASPAARYVTFSVADPKVNILDADAAVVTARINSMNRDSIGNVRRGHQAWSIVLVRRGDGWKIIQAHESYPRGPAPADSAAG
jgi:hypothetical protein